MLVSLKHPKDDNQNVSVRCSDQKCSGCLFRMVAKEGICFLMLSLKCFWSLNCYLVMLVVQAYAVASMRKNNYFSTNDQAIVVLLPLLCQILSQVISEDAILQESFSSLLWSLQAGLATALPGLHAFTGCDFIASFYRKGKVKPLEVLENDNSGDFIRFFQILTKQK